MDVPRVMCTVILIIILKHLFKKKIYIKSETATKNNNKTTAVTCKYIDFINT